MSAGKFWLRTALFIFCVPFFYVLLFSLDHYHHLVFNICVVLVTVVGSMEVEIFFKRKGIPTSGYLFSLLGGTLPLVTYLEIAGITGGNLTFGWFIGLVSLVLLRGLWVLKDQDFSSLLQVISSSMFVLIYPALFISFLVRLSGFNNSSLVLLFFFSLMFVNDIMAYLAGMFLGRKTRLGLLISPNKSGIGFAAGFLSSIGIALLFRYLFPYILSIGYFSTALFGALISILAILGDLAESALKRSAQVKDSSNIIPGRGGILDSMDSWLISLPVFYFVLKAISR